MERRKEGMDRGWKRKRNGTDEESSKTRVELR